MNETKKCPFCGKEILAIAKKCKYCGQWLEKPDDAGKKHERHCPVCDEVIPEDAKICPYCNEPLDDNKKNDENRQALYQAPSLKEMKKSGLFVILIIAIPILAALLIANWDNIFTRRFSSTTTSVEAPSPAPDSRNISNTPTYNEAEFVAIEWSECHNSRDILRMKTLYAQEIYYYHEIYSPDMIARSKETLLEKNPEFHQSISEIQSTVIDQNTIKVQFNKYVQTSANGERILYPSYLILTRIDGKWLISEESDEVTDRNLSKD